MWISFRLRCAYVSMKLPLIALCILRTGSAHELTTLMHCKCRIFAVAQCDFLTVFPCTRSTILSLARCELWGCPDISLFTPLLSTSLDVCDKTPHMQRTARVTRQRSAHIRLDKVDALNEQMSQDSELLEKRSTLTLTTMKFCNTAAAHCPGVQILGPCT